MCGIAGVLGHCEAGIIARMVSALAHRGPDDEGVYLDATGHAALGHRRLSIIDLSPGGHQPMSYAEGRFWVVFNGEIYNYRELRKELGESGLPFRSNSDTEVLLAAYARWGWECVKRLRGMFAFAIWDRHERTLFLARDRMGIKPVLYATLGSGLVFASEMKALLASGIVEPVLDPGALVDLLTNGAVNQPRTFIRGVRFLEAGTSLLVHAGGRLETRRYWDMEEAARPLRHLYARLPFQELVEATREKLEQACQAHLVADVPVGSFLSGGMDSTTITALMARYVSYPIKSFSIGFESTDECRDELGFAALAAERLGCEHAELRLTGGEVAANFDALIDGIDQPSQDGTNTFFVSRLASRSVKVTLAGLGGDELFAGYQHFRLLERAGHRAPTVADRLLAGLHTLRPNRLTLTASYRCLPQEARLGQVRRILSQRQIMRALSSDVRSLLHPQEVAGPMPSRTDDSLDALTQTSLNECHGYLLNTLLRDNDAMSMAHSLEVRPVLLDHPFVEHALALPPEAKIRNGQVKAALVEASRDALPEEIRARGKMGFELPLGAWLRTTLRERFVACARDPAAEAVFCPGFLKGLPRALGDARRTRELWSFLIFWEWFRKNRCVL